MTNSKRFKDTKTRHTLLIVGLVLLAISALLVTIGSVMISVIHKATNKSAKGKLTDVV